MGIVEAIYYLSKDECNSITSVQNKTYTRDCLDSIWNGKHYASFTKGDMNEEELKSKFWRIDN